MVTKDELNMIPAKPGVYLMMNGDGKVIYVGKAVSLRNRVRSYFQSSSNLSPRIARMVEQVDRVDFITTSSEVEALALECNLIKEHKPKYNVRLRDDKQYPWLKITWQEKYPRVFIVRRPQKDGARYFGPYTDVGALREIFRLLRRVFPVRTCKKELKGDERGRPCLNYHIGRCLGPCSGVVDPKEYRNVLEDFCALLEGRSEKLLSDLTKAMEDSATRMEYEKAAAYRDKLKALKRVVERQAVVSTEQKDRDVFGFACGERGGLIQVLQIRRGKLVGNEHFFFPPELVEEKEEFFRSFLLQYYDEQDYIPKEILLPLSLPDAEAFSAWLRGKAGMTVRLLNPKRGEKNRLLKLALDNASTLLAQEVSRRDQAQEAAARSLDRLREILSLNERPKRIEAFDISNFQGDESVASMVVFEEGVPRNDAYRRFKIRGVEGVNDFASLQEAVRRRFSRGLKEQRAEGEKWGFATFPDLLLIDGGKGQLHAVVEILGELGLGGQPVIGLAKQEEEIFLPGRPEPIRLPRNDEGLHLLQRIRDEAHRFAVTYHRSLRDKRTTRSTLDKIKGIGPKRKKALLSRFGSVKKIKEATLEELISVEGITENIARSILQQLEEL